jgi:[acyl-carrier-protein] S-malonyltransferase
MSRVFLFPGYGAQYVGMGKDFYDHYRCVQELFEEASNCLNINFVKLCFASSERELSKPAHAYLALFVVQTCIYTVLLERGIEPSLITGWGVGCCSAYYAAGIINFPDTLYLLNKYLLLLEELVKDRQISTLCVSGISRDELEQIIQQNSLSQTLVLGVIKSSYECIIIGTEEAEQRLCQLLSQKNASLDHEPRAYALHLLCCHEMTTRINMYLAKIDCKTPRYQLLTHEGQFIAVGQPIIKSMLTRFMYEPIDIPKMVHQITSCRILLQMGPSFLTPLMIKQFLPQTEVKIILQCKDLKI